MPLLRDFFTGDEVVTIERAIGLERPLPCIHRKKRPTLRVNLHRGNPIIYFNSGVIVEFERDNSKAI